MPEVKEALLDFLDLTAAYLRDGHTRKDIRGNTGDEALINESNLPLAYTIDEDEESIESLETIAGEISNCKNCILFETRTLTVPGEGAEQPLVMVIGEGPGADEDRAGRPFVGRAGQLLDKMLLPIGLSREENCYIANMVKCRPPGNRDPGHNEILACYSYLERQIKILNPKIILCLGRVAAQALLKTSHGINALRGNFMELDIEGLLIPVLSTYHPSALLRDESLKRPAWEDLKLLKSRLDLTGNQN